MFDPNTFANPIEVKEIKMNVLDAFNLLVENGLPIETVKSVVDVLLENGGIDDYDDLKPLLLFNHLDCGTSDIEVSSYDDCVYTAGGGEYLVVDEYERDRRWDESLDSYLDEGCVEGANSPYFNTEAWKRDARMDGAGHALASYDGNEQEYNVNGSWFYIYRLN